MKPSSHKTGAQSSAASSKKKNYTRTPLETLMVDDLGIEELLREIEAGSGQNDEGLTTKEWAERLGWSMGKAGRVINKLWRAGKIVEGKRAMKKMGGGTHLNNVYRLKPRADKLT